MRKMFSKEQIKKMIEENNTKLYSHEIEDEGENTWCLITNSPESLEGKTLSEIQALFTSNKCIKMLFNNYQLVIALPDDTDDGFIYATDDGIAKAGDDFVSVVSDEVTPL